MRNIMPAKSPKISGLLEGQLHALGESIRRRRKSLKLSTVVVAESSGLSRVTLHRIEKGEPSVTIGAYIAVIDSLGMSLELSASDLNTPEGPTPKTPWIPTKIHLEDFPQLKKIAWHVVDSKVLTPQEALDIYERHWRHIDEEAIDTDELAFINTLRNSLVNRSHV